MIICTLVVVRGSFLVDIPCDQAGQGAGKRGQASSSLQVWGVVEHIALVEGLASSVSWALRGSLAWDRDLHAWRIVVLVLRWQQQDNLPQPFAA